MVNVFRIFKYPFDLIYVFIDVYKCLKNSHKKSLKTPIIFEYSCMIYDLHETLNNHSFLHISFQGDL